MFRYNFLPLELQGSSLVIAVADPSRLMMLDEVAGLLGKHIIPRVAIASQITDLLRRTEQSQRVLDEATEGLVPDAVSPDDHPDEIISIEKLMSQEGLRPDHSAGGHHHLYRARSARLRYSLRDL